MLQPITTQARFLYLCRKLLELFGNNLDPNGGKFARLASVKTPDGAVYVKETDSAFHVSSPGYDEMWSIYYWVRGYGGVLVWNKGSAAEVVPYLEKKLALDLLADI